MLERINIRFSQIKRHQLNPGTAVPVRIIVPQSAASGRYQGWRHGSSRKKRHNSIQALRPGSGELPCRPRRNVCTASVKPIFAEDRMKVPRDRGCRSAAALDQGNARETPPRLERAEMSRPVDIRSNGPRIMTLYNHCANSLS